MNQCYKHSIVVPEPAVKPEEEVIPNEGGEP